jgi:predicted nuclease with TOPRIM domain
VPQQKYGQLEKHAEELEAKLQEQARTIDRLRNLLNTSGGENNEVVEQLQELIGQQSEQFKQMTQNVSEYIKSSAQKVSAKK